MCWQAETLKRIVPPPSFTQESAFEGHDRRARSTEHDRAAQCGRISSSMAYRPLTVVSGLTEPPHQLVCRRVRNVMVLDHLATAMMGGSTMGPPGRAHLHRQGWRSSLGAGPTRLRQVKMKQ